ncbi:ROK family protein [Halochromatium glycolicum]|uniref:Fructokinase n=1 Tax=Halochromatium glycolicum TaxID=85075 RepID=A0AAJ0XAT6_9GAMM|nr:ROK family protein [Halochromatium glycolicum]MBK1706101.1 fructokinase [Halochromatium glycolicum]
MGAPVHIGIDLGGTKIEAAALAADGRMLARKRIATPRGDYPGTLDAIAQLVAELESVLGVQTTVGVGTPGALSPFTGHVRNANSVWLNDRALDADLAQRLGRPVRLANDADCFTLSEATDGAAAGAASVFGVIIGTGTGGGITVHGQLLSGPNAIAGEWGHNPLPWPAPDELPGPECYCGKRGCIETWVSGPALSADLERSTGRRLTGEEIADAAAQGDRDAEAALERHEGRLARALASVINLLDPEVIVLGGGLSNLRRLYTNLPERIQPHAFSDGLATRIVPPRFGDSSGVRGAAWLWRDGARPAEITAARPDAAVDPADALPSYSR